MPRKTTCPHLSGYAGCWLEVPSTRPSIVWPRPAEDPANVPNKPEHASDKLVSFTPTQKNTAKNQTRAARTGLRASHPTVKVGRSHPQLEARFTPPSGSRYGNTRLVKLTWQDLVRSFQDRSVYRNILPSSNTTRIPYVCLVHTTTRLKSRSVRSR